MIKLEGPGGGDDTRSWGPPFLPSKAGDGDRESAYFLSVNRNKKSLCLNLKTAAGQQVTDCSLLYVFSVRCTV